MAVTRTWTKLRYHPEQTRLWRSKSRFRAVWAGRGSGKTELARRRTIAYLAKKKPWPDPIYFYALPTYGQAKRVAWMALFNLVPPEWIKKSSESGMTIETVFGSKLYVVGLDKPQRIEGVQWDGGVVDESSDQRPGVFDRSILPALSHRNGWLWRIGVPKRSGIGAREFKHVCEDWASSDDPNTDGFTWPSEDILTPEQIEWAKRNLDARDYNEQYNANWVDAGGQIFYAFDGVKNVSDQVCYRSDQPITIGCDFNVDPMCWVIGHLASDGFVAFDEIFARNTNTPATLNELFKRYGDHENGFLFHGDAAGKARHTSASVSDYLHIKNDNRFKGLRVFFPKSNPRIADRFASCNALLCNAAGDRRLFIHPRCKHLIQDLEERAYKEGTSEPDDYGDVGHMTDALGYIVHRRFPIRYVEDVGSDEIFGHS